MIKLGRNKRNAFNVIKHPYILNKALANSFFLGVAFSSGVMWVVDFIRYGKLEIQEDLE